MHQINESDSDRRVDVVEEPLDAAGQSLADALRASFGILKAIMLVLVVLYLFSNVRRVESHEQALILRLGRLLPRVHEAGLVWAYPYPIDEVVPLPTKKSNTVLIKSHTFARRAEEIGKSLAFIHRSPTRGLHPSLDGALLTADAGLVHAKWKVTYKIDNVSSYVREILGDQVESAEDLIAIFVETAGIEVASALTAEEIIRTKVDFVQSEIRRKVNQRLASIKSGIVVTTVEMDEPTPPIQVRESFDRTQRAENSKQQQIREAQQERTKILSEAAGAVHGELLDLLDRIDAAKAAGQATNELDRLLDDMLDDRVEGHAGRLIKDAGAYHSIVVDQMESDLDLYRKLLPEYERNSALLIGRLYEETRQKIFRSPGVTKIYRPRRCELRLQISRDPDEKRIEEQRRLQEQHFDVKTLQKRHLIPLGPGAG